VVLETRRNHAKFAVLTLLTALPCIIVATRRSKDFDSEDDSDIVSIDSDIVAAGIPAPAPLLRSFEFNGDH